MTGPGGWNMVEYTTDPTWAGKRLADLTADELRELIGFAEAVPSADLTALVLAARFELMAKLPLSVFEEVDLSEDDNWFFNWGADRI
jgi:hypothetical protein